MNKLFGENNWFMNFFTRVADALILNIIFLVCLFLIIPAGPAYTAMYYFCIKAAGNEEGYLLKSFWKSFKLNFLQGVVMEVIFGVAAYIVYIDVQFMYNRMTESGSILWKILFFLVIGMAILIVSTFMYTFPVLSRFDNRTFTTIKNAALMSIRHMGQTVPMLLILMLCAFVGWAMFPVSMFFIFGAWVYISSFFFNKIFRRYMIQAEGGNPDDNMYMDNPDEEINATEAIGDEEKNTTEDIGDEEKNTMEDIGDEEKNTMED